MNRITIFLVLISLLLSCKKNKLPPNIIESNIDFNAEDTDVEEIGRQNIFEPNARYKSYFSAAGLSLTNEFIFIGTQAPYDHDFAPADLQIKRTDFEFNQVKDQKLFRANDARLNSVTPSLIRVGDVCQFYYLRQESESDAQIYLIESHDGGETWENERKISFVPGYNGIINDRVTVLASGRIIIPVAFTTNIDSRYDEQFVFCYYSDNNGFTWSKSTELTSSTPLMEPSVAEYAPGKLLMVIRSRLGKLLLSRSVDNGITWSTIRRTHLNSPNSTSAVYKIAPGILALIWNNTISSVHVLDRKPLSLSISKDNGESWSRSYQLGNVDGEIYSSPGMFKHYDDWIVYFNYSNNNSEYGIRAKKIKIKH